MEDQNKEIVLQAFDAWVAGTGSPLDLFADEIDWTLEGSSVISRTYRSRTEFVEEVIKRFGKNLSKKFCPAIRRIHAEENTVIVLFDAEAVAGDGIPYRNSYVWFLDMQNGKIVGGSAFFDTIVLNAFWSHI